MVFRKKFLIRFGNKGLDFFYEVSIMKWKYIERLVVG